MTKQQLKYCIQRLERDEKSKLDTWINTKRCSNDIEVLKIICARNQRVFKRETGEVVFTR